MPTVVCLPNQFTVTIPIGSIVVINGGLVRVFDSSIDWDQKNNSLDTDVHIVGVAYPSINNNGRGYESVDGPEFYFEDSVEWNEDLTCELDVNHQPIQNDQFVPWNSTVSSQYTYVLMNGFGPLLNDHVQYAPKTWIVTNLGNTISMALIK